MELSETGVLFYTEKRKSVLIAMDQNSVARASCNATLVTANCPSIFKWATELLSKTETSTFFFTNYHWDRFSDHSSCIFICVRGTEHTLKNFGILIWSFFRKKNSLLLHTKITNRKLLWQATILKLFSNNSSKLLTKFDSQKTRYDFVITNLWF